jgi:hypothetical protein
MSKLERSDEQLDMIVDAAEARVSLEQGSEPQTSPNQSSTMGMTEPLLVRTVPVSSHVGQTKMNARGARESTCKHEAIDELVTSCVIAAEQLGVKLRRRQSGVRAR